MIDWKIKCKESWLEKFGCLEVPFTEVENMGEIPLQRWPTEGKFDEFDLMNLLRLSYQCAVQMEMSNEQKA